MIVRVILLVLGLVSGVLLAGALFYGFLGSSPQQAQAPQAPAAPPPPPVMVVVAAKTIPTGALIQFQDLRFAAVPAAQQTGGLFLRIAAPNTADQAKADHEAQAQVVGAVSRRRFGENDPIQRGDIVKPGDAGFLAAVLQPGKRAIAIGVNAVTGTAGLIYPGDHVDIILTQVFPGKETDPGGRSASETIATDIRVIAIDQQMQATAPQQKDVRPASTVTIEVDPVQAEQVDVAAKLGELSLAIRAVQAEADGKDSDPEPPAPVWGRDVSAAARHAAITAPPPAASEGPPAPKDSGPPSGQQIRVMRGEKSENVAVP
jgi:pilus assembly protein CpaB